jgi:hypothetical protein
MSEYSWFLLSAHLPCPTTSKSEFAATGANVYTVGEMEGDDVGFDVKFVLYLKH